MSFLSLPSELRNIIYELVVLWEEPISPWSWYDRQFTPGLLCTNKVIHPEASSLLYSQNHFDFTSCTSGIDKIILFFFDEICSTNTGYIRHIIIDFPLINADDITLDENELGVLENLQSRCANLTTLTTSLYSTALMENRLDSLDNYKLVTEALMMVDDRFRASSSLQEIIVDVYEDGPSDYIRQEMRARGWRICSIIEEDWSRSLSDLDDDEYGYNGFVYSDGDDDPIPDGFDDDSDFWRRAREYW
ncbi:hypothetical protein V8F06_012108 [Rhypophila decipiens]